MKINGKAHEVAKQVPPEMMLEFGVAQFR